MTMTELDAARFVRAALYLIRPEIPERDTELALMLSRWTGDVHERIEKLERDAPPWTPERPERPERERSWAQVVPGDDVLAPDNAWYHVDAWSRTGEQVNVLIVVNGDKVPVGMPAGQAVMVRRGPEGQAVDVLRDAFPDVEVIRK